MDDILADEREDVLADEYNIFLHESWPEKGRPLVAKMILDSIDDLSHKAGWNSNKDFKRVIYHGDAKFKLVVYFVTPEPHPCGILMGYAGVSVSGQEGRIHLTDNVTKLRNVMEIKSWFIHELGHIWSQKQKLAKGWNMSVDMLTDTGGAYGKDTGGSCSGSGYHPGGLPPSRYGFSDHEEDFAESFTYMVYPNVSRFIYNMSDSRKRFITNAWK